MLNECVCMCSEIKSKGFNTIVVITSDKLYIWIVYFTQ